MTWHDQFLLREKKEKQSEDFFLEKSYSTSLTEKAMLYSLTLTIFIGF